MLDLLSGFVAELRAAGLPVSLRETIDAADAVRAVDITRRSELRAALGATLVKSEEHWPVFATAFDVYFSRHAQPGELAGLTGDLADVTSLVADGETESTGDRLSSLDPRKLAELVREALASGDAAQLAALARLAVRAFAGIEPGRPVGVSYYLFRTLRALDLEGAVGALGTAGSGGVSLGDEADELAVRLGELGTLGERLISEEYADRARLLRELIEAEIRRQLVAERGSEAVAASLRRPLVEDVDFMHATSSELVAMRRAIFPLTRALAARLARRRRHRHRGPLDMRATIHRSLSTGGVPFEIRYRAAHPAKPEIFVIADVSGSVASFARFTLHLVYAIAAQFSKVRSFVFVDGVDEVTNIFERATSITEAISRVALEADVIDAEGHSNYGHVLEAFMERYGHDVTARTNVLILGDGRNNYHAAHAEVLTELRRRARRLYWLNPEPRAYWGSGDSIIEEYGREVDGVYECRNLRQLERFVETLA